jgi:hypothetical protein
MPITVGCVSDLGIDGARVRDFLSRNWRRRIALTSPEFYDWQFTRSPADAGNDHCGVAVDSTTNEIVGVMGLNERGFHLNGSEVLGAELTTWAVEERLKGSGVGALILRSIQARYHVLIGMGITESAMPVYIRSGFRYISAVPRFVNVIDFAVVEQIAEAKPLAKKIWAHWRNNRNPVMFSAVPYLGAGMERICAAARRDSNFFDRAHYSIEWRYLRHPIFAYKTFIIGDKASHAESFVAIREETSIVGLRLVHVLDVFGDPTAIPAALAFIDDYCRQGGFHAADFFCTSSRVNAFLYAGGWFSTMDDHCLRFPHLFHPLEMRIPPTTSFAFWARNRMAEMSDLSRLYVTKQDADLDRPTLATYEAMQGGEGSR